MNKTEMLTKMGELGACDKAKTFVSASPHENVKEIGLSCDRVDWLCWFLFRIRPDLAPIFARECADRAKGYAAAGAADRDADRAADRAAEAARECADRAAEAADWADCAARAARAAAYWADCVARAAEAAEAAEAAAAWAAAAARAAADRAAERQAQLKSLHKMWAEVFSA